MAIHDPDIHVTMTRTVAESLCDHAGIRQHDGQQSLVNVPIGTWYDPRDERWTWALDEATRWAIVRLAEMDPEWEDATATPPEAALALDSDSAKRVVALSQELLSLLHGAYMER